MQTLTQPSGKFSKVGWTEEAADSTKWFRRWRGLWVIDLAVAGGEVVIPQAEDRLGLLVCHRFHGLSKERLR